MRIWITNFFVAERNIDVAEDEGIEDSDPKGKLTLHPSRSLIESNIS